MYNKKRGAVAIQFQWLFIMIVGALIILFFVSVVGKVKDVSDNTVSVKVSTTLHSILTSSKVSTGTVSEIIIPSIDITFDCEGFSVGPESLDIGASFAPFLIKSVEKKAYSWAVSWDVPYKITNFLYLTSSDVKYYVDASVYDMLPEEINKEIFPASLNQDNYKVKLVYTQPFPRPNVDDSLKKIDIRAVAFDSDNLDGYGEVEFYEYDHKNEIWSTAEISYYVGKASAFGAIFADDKETYECNMQKAFGEAAFITQIYLDRLEEIADTPAVNPLCSNVYANGLSALDGTPSLPGLLYFFNADFDSFSDIAGFGNAITQLESANSQAKVKSV